MRTSWAIWHCISEETKEGLKVLLPVNYRPPREHPSIDVENIEDLNELTKIMKQKPRHLKKGL